MKYITQEPDLVMSSSLSFDLKNYSESHFALCHYATKRLLNFFSDRRDGGERQRRKMTAQGEAVSLVVQNLRPGVHLLMSEPLIVGQNKLERCSMKSLKGFLLMFNEKV